MLRIIEFSLLAVTFAVILGLIISGARTQSRDSTHPGDSSARPEQNKPL